MASRCSFNTDILPPLKHVGLWASVTIVSIVYLPPAMTDPKYTNDYINRTNHWIASVLLVDIDKECSTNGILHLSAIRSN